MKDFIEVHSDIIFSSYTEAENKLPKGTWYVHTDETKFTLANEVSVRKICDDYFLPVIRIGLVHISLRDEIMKLGIKTAMGLNFMKA